MLLLLPDYIVPVLFLPLIQIPQAATGKTDQKQLQAITTELTPKEIRAYRTEQAGDSRVQSILIVTEHALQQV